MGRNERMARRLDGVASFHEREAERRERAGDPAGARRAAEHAAAARRAQAVLTAGPGGVRDLFAA